MLSEIRKNNLEKNIWKFYLYRVFSCLSFITPIYFLFLLDNGLNLTQVMILQSIYTAVIMLSAVPSGIVADQLGRKKILIINAVLFTLAWMIFAVSHNFLGFLIGEITAALSAGMWLASGTAFFYDNLKELKRESDFKKLFGNVVGINYVMWGLSSLVGGYIAVHSLRFPFWITSVTAFIALIITFTFTETKIYGHRDKHYLKHLKNSLIFIKNHQKVRLLIIYSGIFVAVSFIGYILYQPYLESINIPLAYFGLVYLIIFLLAAVGSKTAHLLETYIGEKKILIILLIIPILSFFGMTKGLIVVGVIFPILLSFGSGVFEPVVTDYINKHTKSHHRATVMSLSTLVNEFLSTIIAPFFGWVVDFWSLSTAFLLAMILLVINLIILIITFELINRKS